MTTGSKDLFVRDILLSIVAGGFEMLSEDELRFLDEDVWASIMRRAGQHRLLPMLHFHFEGVRSNCVPDWVRNACRSAFRTESLKSMRHQSTLIEISRLFDRSSIQYAAMKGIPLSIEYYPNPALRPMRDIDIIVAPDQAIKAQQLLKENGYVRRPGLLDHGLEEKHHLPLLLSPNDVGVEIHFSVSDRGWPSATKMAELLLANAQEYDLQGHSVWFVDPTDNLLHLTAHSCLQHLFDNGPLVLADLRMLEDRDDVDWPRLERNAKELGLAASWSLLMKLLDRFSNKVGSPRPSICTVPSSAVDQAASLLAQDCDLSRHRSYLRRNNGRGPFLLFMSGIVRALRPTAKDMARVAGVERSGIAKWRAYPTWLYEGSRMHFISNKVPELAGQANVDCALRDWLYPSHRNPNAFGQEEQNDGQGPSLRRLP